MQKFKYPKYFIDKSVSSAKRRFYNPSVDNKNNKYNIKNTIALPCHPKLLSVNFLNNGNNVNNKISLTFWFSGHMQ